MISVRGPRPTPIELTADEKAHLKRITRCYTLPHREVVRAQVILMASGGLPNAQIARELKIAENTVRKWRNRFLKDRGKGLKDSARPGAPSAFSPSG